MTEGVSWKMLCEASVALSFSFWRSVVSTAYYFNYLANSKQYFRIMIVGWWLFLVSVDKVKLILAFQGNKRKYTFLKLLLSQCQLLNWDASYLYCYQLFFFNFSFMQTLPTLKLLPSLCNICSNKTNPHILFFICLMAMHCEKEGRSLFNWIPLLHMKTVAPKLMRASLLRLWPSDTPLLYLSSPPPCLHLCSPSFIHAVTAQELSRWQSSLSWDSA